MTTQYLMRAVYNPSGAFVYWVSPNTDDPTGALSGYNPSDLSDIQTDCVVELPNSVGLSVAPDVPANGDLSGSYPSPTVVKLQGNDVASGLPDDGYVLTWSTINGRWEAQEATGGGGGGSPTGSAGGDLFGTYPNPTVAGLRGRVVNSTAPTDGYVLTWDQINNYWKPAILPIVSSITISGDVTGTTLTSYVSALHGYILSSTPPTDGYVLTYNTDNGWISKPTKFTNIEQVGHRLTLTSGVPVTTADVNSSTVYFTPYKSNQIALYTGNGWDGYTTNEISIAIPNTGSFYTCDVFIYLNGTTPTLELSAAWSTSTARADALAQQDGVWVKSSNHTRRYLGTFQASSGGTVGDSYASRGLWNYYNKVPRFMKCFQSTDSWAYTTASYRASNNQGGNLGLSAVAYVAGFADIYISATATSLVSTSSGPVAVASGIGNNTSTVNTATSYGATINSTTLTQLVSEFKGYSPSIGYNLVVWLEYGGSGVTFYGDNGTPTSTQAGMVAEILG